MVIPFVAVLGRDAAPIKGFSNAAVGITLGTHLYHHFAYIPLLIRGTKAVGTVAPLPLRLRLAEDRLIAASNGPEKRPSLRPSGLLKSKCRFVTHT